MNKNELEKAERISVRCRNIRPKIKKDVLEPTMNNFEEYLRQGEPNKAEKAKVMQIKG